MRCRPAFTSRAIAAMPGALALLLAGAAQAEGLSVTPDRSPWTRWQARVEWTPPPLGWTDRRMLPSRPWPTPGLRLLGETGPGGAGGTGGEGLRASAGLVFSPTGMRLPASPVGAAGGPDERWHQGWQTQGYVGLGYSHRPSGSAWRFNADVGVLGSGLRFDNLSLGGFDVRLRELRLSPLLQVGASYAF
ncbi:hypothetical protein [Aquabacterium sp. J223]|uniref:hypothetical protein n=1 Tax=Aquabacterium sp. J223 TaxID=2898431 RepID=UPI0021AD7311|nr:hypothetical protein [Aquabacterium sp. J223]UUX95755.1 hypothetical protein LRS07_21625 [Aquabacterium sp. J223]